MPASKELIGVKEIARRANVSKGTVDRVIHNRTGVSEETRARVNAIIKEVDYKPNVLAQRLAKSARETFKIIVLLPSVSEESEFWQAPQDGVDQALSEIAQYGVVVKRYFFDQNEQSSFAKAVSAIAHEKAVDGILLTPTFEQEAKELASYCDKHQIPYVFINSDLPSTQRLSYIGPKLFDSGRLAGELAYVALQEKQKAGIIHIAKEIVGNNAVLEKEEGFRSYFQDRKAADQVFTFSCTETGYESVRTKLDDVFAKSHDIGLLYVTNSRSSLVARWAKERGMQDILIIGNDHLTDNLRYLEDGFINFLLCERPNEQGYRGIMAIFQLAVHKKEMSGDYFTPIDIITRTNLVYYRN
ncbi:LacI family DNA-binding transcriptional regulator [Sphingobacterium chungjuense]|uniref:LacI family DNA-binding transcriptional regulator n=1 Tax=Sphingobacterium chungjuense TaxID=2675553 RepID=UPI0014093BBE|nr:substrate-binding domain-containing protein [Sphingobacterium chungjuense]